VRHKAQLLEAKHCAPSGWPTRGFVRAATGAISIPTPGYERKTMEARVAATWEASALRICGELDHLGEIAVGSHEETEDDGYTFTLRLAVGNQPVVVSFRIAPTQAGAVAKVWTPYGWRPHHELSATRVEVGTSERFELVIPTPTLGPQTLIAGIVCPFDWWVQRTDGDGRRAILEWVRGYTLPEEPTGLISLG
jgi:hypothetical protein